MILQYFRILKYHWSMLHSVIICCICHKLLQYIHERKSKSCEIRFKNGSLIPGSRETLLSPLPQRTSGMALQRNFCRVYVSSTGGQLEPFIDAARNIAKPLFRLMLHPNKKHKFTLIIPVKL